ncbi:PEP/pyruvate-binding domain-containing protein [Thermodesulfobacteriota bacterium]
MHASEKPQSPPEVYSRFKLYHELMPFKIREILLVSSPYDAFIIEEDVGLASRIINEYRGLNLSQPPRITRTSSAYSALALLKQKRFDMVITMTHLDDMDPFSLGAEIKKVLPNLPVILLTHSAIELAPPPNSTDTSGIDKTYIWSGFSDLLLALIKNAEDQMNVQSDTEKAGVRVLILVEDSSFYYSSFLPFIYKEIVRQTQSVLAAGLNEEHRLLTMRTRPKILLAENYEEAIGLYKRYHSYLLGIISDTSFPRNNRSDENAGYSLLTEVRKDIPYLPLLLLSSESKNREKADTVPAQFIDKNSPDILSQMHDFFLEYLGFGDFVFRMPDGSEIGRASTLQELEEKLSFIPDESILYHAPRNNFSTWIMSRSEITLASKLRKISVKNDDSIEDIRQSLISEIRQLRMWRQKGVVASFSTEHFDHDIMDFVKIGQGSLGGKARGLAFMSAIFQNDPSIYERYSDINVEIPKTLVVTTDGFESFIHKNNLSHFAQTELPDEDIAHNFLKADMPQWLEKELEEYVAQVYYPLAVRSSSLLEDAQSKPYAGLYETYMIPNNHPDPSKRFEQLIMAIKLVYASTYYEGPRSFSSRPIYKPQEEAMGVIIQKVAGNQYGDYFYPAVGGVAQSYNYYPISHMRPEDGIANIALGLGKTVVDGENALRFCPKYPNMLPQFSTIDDILENAQRYFYALKMNGYPDGLKFFEHSNLIKRDVSDAVDEFNLKSLSSTYIAEDHRIRDSGNIPGMPVITFAQILKHKTFPLPELLSDLLELGRKNMGCPVIIEFSVTLNEDRTKKDGFSFLQIRPMASEENRYDTTISQEEIKNAIGYSTQALGNGKKDIIYDIVYVKPESFRPEETLRIAGDIGQINGALKKEERPYLLMGPGRWGSADRWLGIPVQWKDISGVEAIIELKNKNIKADASQGSHFFQNITCLGIYYITINEETEDFFRWKWIESLPTNHETDFLRHVRLENPLMIILDGDTSQCVIMER